MADSKDFKLIVDRWQKFILGDNLDLEDKDIRAYVEKLNKEANDLFDGLVKSENSTRELLWDDLKIKKYNVQNNKKIEYNAGRLEFDQVWYSFIRLSTISRAIRTKGCDLYGDSYAIEEVLKGLDMLSGDYFSVNAQPYGNWWNWEIGIPQSFLVSIMVLREYISKERLESYLAPLNKFVKTCEISTVMKNNPKMTGANLLDKASSHAMIGVLEENDEKLRDVLRIIKKVFTFANNTNKKITQQNDGFWRDGSYIQHAGIAYTGGYGAVLYGQIAIFLSVFKGSPWECSYPDHCENIAYESIFIGIAPQFYNGRFMDMTSGRGISRAATNDKNRGAGMLSAMLPYIDAMPTEDMKNELMSFIKYQISVDEEYFYANCGNINSLAIAKKLMSDDSVEAVAKSNFNKCFASMDKTVHARPNYTLALSMHSNRMYNHEIFNREGKSTGNISDGMTYLYDSDDLQFGDGFWGSVDVRRLPGITSEYVLRKEGAGHFKKNPYNFVGMTNVDSYGVSAMHLRTLGNGSAKNGTKAKKSWFMFDDEIVCLGSDIKSSTGNYVETIIDNRKIDIDALDEISINAKVRDDLLVSELSAEPKGKIIDNVSFMHLSAERGSQIGYTFPKPTKIKALKEIRKTNWITIGNCHDDITRAYATFLFDHGVKPRGGSYAYCLLPNFTGAQTEAYASNQPYEILCMDSKAHILKHNKLGITGAVLWKKSRNYNNGFKSSEPVVAMVKDEDRILKLSLADPTQSKKSIKFSFNTDVKDVLNKDDNIEVISLNPVTIKVNTFESYGRSFEVEFAK